MNLIDKIPFAHFKALTFRNEQLWKSYEQLNGFISKNFDNQFNDVLAKPFAADNGINWYSVREGEFKPLDNFSVAEKQTLLLRYHYLLNQVNAKVSELKLSSNQDNHIWADLLSLSFAPANNILYSNGEHLVIAWGFNFNNDQDNYVDPLIVSTYIQNQLSREGELLDNEDLSSVENPDNIISNKVDENDNLIGGKKIIIRSNKKQVARNSFLRHYWWVLLFLPLFILLLLFLDNSGVSSSPSGIPANLLKRPPIDSSKLVRGDSGISLIVSDIFNIALKDKTEDLNTFSIELKKQFPDSAYEIVYYDTSTLRIQFKFPDSNRSELKAKIKDKMDDYELLIWDESIFQSFKTFNDPALSDAEKSWYLTAVGVYDAWDVTTGKRDVVIAVIDDGFDLNNQDFSNKVVKPYNVKSRSSNVDADLNRIHGTHVAGLALGNANNAFGISGIAPECSFMPIQITESDDLFSSSDVIDAILYAIKNDADVINISLGKYYNESVTNLSLERQKDFAQQLGKDEEEFWNELLTYAEKENSTIVFATGNQNILVGLDPMLRSEKAIKVAAINQNLSRTSFSNFGDKVTVYAPGEKINSIVPGNQEKILDGTSMASPIVAGSIALMKSINKNITLDKIKELLKSTGEQVRGETSGTKYIKINKLIKAV